MKAQLIAILLIATIAEAQGQTMDFCDKKLTNDQLMIWRSEMKFKPKYMSVKALDYLLGVMSPQAYQQFQIEAAVRCMSHPDHENFVKAFQIFYDNSVDQAIVEKYFHACYVFMQLDKHAMGHPYK